MSDTFNINKYPKTKKYVSLYFHVHQPYRLSSYSVFDIGSDKDYFNGPIGKSNKEILDRVVKVGYKESNSMFLDLIKNKSLKVSYSITGTLLDQLKEDYPFVIDQYKEMINHKGTEIISETYYHSLAGFYSRDEFVRQVRKHTDNLEIIFGQRPNIFRNTEFTFRNDIGEMVRQLGFKAIFTEGWDPILDWRSPNYLYSAKREDLTIENGAEEQQEKLTLLLKNYNRSDDVAFRFQLNGWEGYPVTADKFAEWITEEPGFLINLCMDYETIGEHHRVESGIFDFYRKLPDEFAKRGIEFILPSDAVELEPISDELDYPYIVSWADQERDLSAWMGNKMQENSLKYIYELSDEVYKKAGELGESEQELLDTFGKLQTSDHFYYMSTKYWSDGDVHKYFSPFNSPYEAYINYSNVLRDFKIKYLGY